MTICYFGNYNPDYARNRILISGLRQNGVIVLECQTRKSGLAKYWSLYWQHLRLKNNYDMMIVGFSGYSVMRLARWLCRKTLVFDAFVSLYLSDVEDRRLHVEGSKAARRLAVLDRQACLSADLVLIDTQKQAEYFCHRYNLPKGKFLVLPAGSDDAVMKKKFIKSEKNIFKIHWHGNILPFYNLGVVAQAAKILERYNDINFHLIIPAGPAQRKFKELSKTLNLTNLEIHDRVTYEALAGLINQADICLGIFGDSLKAGLVIPNKIYEASACGKTVITARHEVLAEVFKDGLNIITVPPNDPPALADKIMWLKENPGESEKIANNALQLFKSRLAPKVLGKTLINNLELLLK